MSDMITRGKALYWGTSEWSADEIRAAYDIAERHHLHKPVMEQPQYNLFHRKRVEEEYKRLYEDIGLGLTTWSPLASGLLTGKYRDGVPADSRAQLQGYDWLRKQVTDAGKNNVVGKLGEVADELGCTVGQLGDWLDSEEPACQHRDHGRVAGRTDRREHEIRRSGRADHPGDQSSGSRKSSATRYD